MRGRKPKPTYLKVLDGGGPAPSCAAAPAAGIKAPTCPQHLSASAKAEWKRLARHLFGLGAVTVLDRATLAAYCQAYGRWVEAERKLQDTPALLKMPSGYVQQNPWLTIANKQLELMHKYLGELGLSPVARSRIDLTDRRFARALSPARPPTPADQYLRQR